MSSSSDDEWGTAELDIPSKSEGNKSKGDGNGNGDDDWDNKGKHLQVIDADDDGDDDEWMPKQKYLMHLVTLIQNPSTRVQVLAAIP